MRRRLFIAVNLPEEIKKAIRKKLSEIPPVMEIRFVGEENWHLTLVFLGYQEEEKLENIFRAMAEAAENFSPFEINFSDINWGPSDKSPRMIWLNGAEESSRKLSPLKDLLEEKLIAEGINFKQEQKMFRIHITLARFRRLAEENFSALPPHHNRHGNNFSESQAQMPVWCGGLSSKFGELRLSFIPESLDLMESHLSRSGAEYEILQKINFK